MRIFLYLLALALFQTPPVCLLAAAPEAAAESPGAAAQSSQPAAGREDLDDPRSALALEDLPGKFVQTLRQESERIAAREKDAEAALGRFLQCEKAGQHTESFALIEPEVRKGFLKEERNRAIVNQVQLFKHPPANPNPGEKEAIERTAALVKTGRLTPQIEDPALWVYQWTHSTGSIQGEFETTGAYANHFRLVDFKIIRVTLAPVKPDLAIAWVEETIQSPEAIRTVRMSEFVVREREGAWRLYSQRPLTANLVYSWLGQRTVLWPDEAAEAQGLTLENLERPKIGGDRR